MNVSTFGPVPPANQSAQSRARITAKWPLFRELMPERLGIVTWDYGDAALPTLQGPGVEQ